MTDTTDAAPAAPASSAVTARPIGADVVAVFQPMLEAVPDAGGDGMDGILEIIAQATSANDLDAAWNAQGLRHYLNVPIVVEGIRKMPSEFDSGLSHFLIVDGYTSGDGAPLHATTGATGPVAQLVKAHQLAAFPWTVIPRESKKPTAEGYHPMHLETVR